MNKHQVEELAQRHARTACQYRDTPNEKEYRFTQSQLRQFARDVLLLGSTFIDDFKPLDDEDPGITLYRCWAEFRKSAERIVDA